MSIVGAVAATAGRLALARLSKWLIRQKLLGKSTKDNIDELRKRLEGKEHLTAGIFLLYAFGPFPSNHLFIAYGLTGLPLGPVAIPFLFGRLVSYTFWAFTASQVARVMAYRAIEGGSFFSYYFILTQLFTILTIYLFARIDWKRLFTERKIKLIGHGTNNAPGCENGMAPK